MAFERRWHKWYDPDVPTQLYYPVTTMKDEFIKWVRAQPSKPYIVCNDKVYTYKETNEMAKRLANALLSLGIKKVTELPWPCPIFLNSLSQPMPL